MIASAAVRKAIEYEYEYRFAEYEYEYRFAEYEYEEIRSALARCTNQPLSAPNSPHLMEALRFAPARCRRHDGIVQAKHKAVQATVTTAINATVR
jgi:hypothetical protein